MGFKIEFMKPMLYISNANSIHIDFRATNLQAKDGGVRWGSLMAAGIIMIIRCAM